VRRLKALNDAGFFEAPRMIRRAAAWPQNPDPLVPGKHGRSDEQVCAMRRPEPAWMRWPSVGAIMRGIV